MSSFKDAIHPKEFDFTQELCFGSICVSHWKCHLTKRVVDNKETRKNGERKWEGEYRYECKETACGKFDSIKE